MIVSLDHLLCLFVRASGFSAFLPISTSQKDVILRFGLAIGMAMAFYDPTPLEISATPIALCFEFLLGILVALPTYLLVQVMAGWGEIFDSARGQTIGRWYDPSGNGAGDSPTARLLEGASWAFLVLSGALIVMLSGFAESLLLFPVGAGSPDSAGDLGMQTVKLIIANLDQLFSLFLPVAALFFILDLLSGFLAKLLPNLSLSSETFQIKSILGLFLLGALVSHGGSIDILSKLWGSSIALSGVQSPEATLSFREIYSALGE
ncbi:MAG: flagellar biosynthetic protein FliR [Bdellovibrionales bacterium]|nr:flagellar biosynthetic protein FliR [Bdellovibrionales bacterium]